MRGRKKERERECVCVCERERKTERVCVYVCVRERERVCVCVYERERERDDDRKRERETDREIQTLLGDLEHLATDDSHSLQHLVGADVGLEIPGVPELAKQLSQSVHCTVWETEGEGEKWREWREG